MYSHVPERRHGVVGVGIEVEGKDVRVSRGRLRTFLIFESLILIIVYFK
jgi:hypothetical protein